MMQYVSNVYLQWKVLKPKHAGHLPIYPCFIFSSVWSLLCIFNVPNLFFNLKPVCLSKLI